LWIATLAGLACDDSGGNAAAGSPSIEEAEASRHPRLGVRQPEKKDVDARAPSHGCPVGFYWTECTVLILLVFERLAT